MVRLSGGSLLWGRKWAHISLAPLAVLLVCATKKGFLSREYGGAGFIPRCLHAGRSRKPDTLGPGTSWSEKVRGVQGGSGSVPGPFPSAPAGARSLRGACMSCPQPPPGQPSFLPEALLGGRPTLPHSDGATKLGGSA